MVASPAPVQFRSLAAVPTCQESQITSFPTSKTNQPRSLTERYRRPTESTRRLTSQLADGAPHGTPAGGSAALARHRAPVDSGTPPRNLGFPWRLPQTPAMVVPSHGVVPAV